MTVYDTDARLALGYGIAAIVAAIAAAAGCAIAFVLLPKSWASMLLVLGGLGGLVLTGWLAYQLYGLAHTTYALDRNAFVIRWGGYREIVPMGEVQRVLNGSEIADKVKVRRVPLPGWWRGEGLHPELGRIKFFGTEGFANQLVVVTPDASYAVSPYDIDAFLDSFRIRFEMGPTQPVTHAVLPPAHTNLDLWNDRGSQLLLLAGTGLNLLALALALARYPSLPARVPLHFGAAGVADRTGGPDAVFPLVGLGLFMLVLNAALGLLAYSRKEWLGAALIWSGNLVIQVLLLISIGFVTLSY
jgi:hypothetical protein